MIKDDANCCPSKLKMFGDYENLPDFPKAIADPYGVSIFSCFKNIYYIILYFVKNLMLIIVWSF